MNRRHFLGLSVTGATMIMGLEKIISHKKTEKMPALFIGHGSPMNAIETNDFTRMLSQLGKTIPTPEAILCISAHWMTEGSWLTKMDHPKTIHDFYGFPKSLFDVQYPAPGRPDIAGDIQNTVMNPVLHLDTENWGLDHGSWSILRHMYPEANVPVIQLSLDMRHSAEYHFKLGQELSKLRERGILIVGSGNIVHNLRTINWETHSKPLDWALEFDHWAKEKLLKRDFKALQTDFLRTEAGRLSVPTMEHYYPLQYITGLASQSDEIKFEFEEIHNASISMRCFSVG